MIGAETVASHVRPHSISQGVNGFDWQRIREELDEGGHAVLEQLLSPEECRSVSGLYTNDDCFRSRIVMARHGFGRGEYKYFRYPLPGLVGELRSAVYTKLVPVANQWNEAMGFETRFPADHVRFVERCHSAGQMRPTPLLLQYVAGDFNCLHQDLYGEHVFPLQLAILLSEPAEDFTGGEFVMTEQRPRMQSRASVVPLGRTAERTAPAALPACDWPCRAARRARRLSRRRSRRGA